MPFGYCLNTSTIKGQNLSLLEEIAITAEAGYGGIEPWVSELDAYVEGGGDLDALGRRIADAGLEVPNVIGFFEWAVDDGARRAQGLREARRNLEQARRIGARRLAAPPMGITGGGVNLDAVAERYAALLAIGEEYGVTPMLEFWGMSKSLGRLSEALYIAAETGRRDACLLADVFHIYKGSGNFAALRLLGPDTLGLFHVNDYPADPPRAVITDAARVFPGDGIAPLGQIFADLARAGFTGMLSLELFNPTYWAMDAREAAMMGLAKLKAVMESSTK
ncbi:MAG: Inosose isomerase [bacterium ADurb.Bin429]|nr:MAG: Inosose isomerase [bacterium ADurb.Bin429]